MQCKGKGSILGVLKLTSVQGAGLTTHPEAC